MPPLKMLILGFAAGFIATLIFHQGLWSVFNHTGVIPPDRPAWPVDPIPPFGIPSVLSKAFWGGLWGLVLTPVLAHLSGASYWVASLKRSAEASKRRKADPFRSAMSMLVFYINRAGKTLSEEHRARLETAKDELRKAFGRPPKK